VPYDSRTKLVGIVARHADDCPVRAGEGCRCGPLGYCAGVWDWQANAWVSSPLFGTLADARDWQRAAHGLVENDPGAAATDTTASRDEDGTDPSEQFFWWAFCYVGLGFLGVALALLTAGLAG
jgi:hypothetical protein